MGILRARVGAALSNKMLAAAMLTRQKRLRSVVTGASFGCDFGLSARKWCFIFAALTAPSGGHRLGWSDRLPMKGPYAPFVSPIFRHPWFLFRACHLLYRRCHRSV